eukprot:m.174024 g.174024  ORF g.174024 m.174024 type:complete len:414 (-) comp18316_c0_seq1:456-1697(-)
MPSSKKAQKGKAVVPKITPSKASKKASDEISRMLLHRIDGSDALASGCIDIIHKITHTEKKLGERYQVLSQAMQVMSTTESQEPRGLLSGLAEVGTLLNHAQEHRRVHCSQINERVIDTLSKVKEQCKNMRSKVGERDKLYDKRANKVKQLDNTARKRDFATSKNRVGKLELKQMTKELARVDTAVVDKMVKYERKRTKVLQVAMEDLISSQMVFYGRSLEILSEAYNVIHSVDPEVDVTVLKEMKTPSGGVALTEAAAKRESDRANAARSKRNKTDGKRPRGSRQRGLLDSDGESDDDSDDPNELNSSMRSVTFDDHHTSGSRARSGGRRTHLKTTPAANVSRLECIDDVEEGETESETDDAEGDSTGEESETEESSGEYTDDDMGDQPTEHSVAVATPTTAPRRPPRPDEY